MWDGAERVEFRTHVSGSIGRDHLLRVRFPARVPGGLPVYQTATAVIGRPFGAPEADVAQHWWTLDNPANHWFGLGAVARAVLAASSGDVPVALGVAEVITPDVVPDERRPADQGSRLLAGGGGRHRDDLARLRSPLRVGRRGLQPAGLPDRGRRPGGERLHLGAAHGVRPGGGQAAGRAAGDGNSARLWVPAAKSRAAAFAPSADLRGVRDLPVLIIAAAEPGDLDQAVAELRGELAGGPVRADVAGGQDLGGRARRRRRGPRRRGRRAVQPGHPRARRSRPDGTLWMSLFRACGGWPSGVWIDGDRQAVPDGSSFAWQHWSHTFSYALASSGAAGGWREAGFNPAAEEYNHDLTAMVTGPTERADQADPAGLLSVEGAPNVTLSALKPFGNPLAAGGQGRHRPIRRPPGDGAAAGDRRAAGHRPAADGGRHRGRLAHRPAGRADREGQPAAGGAGRHRLRPAGAVRDRHRGRPAGRRHLGRSAAAAAGPGAAAAAPPEPVQPVYARYWLHGKGPPRPGTSRSRCTSRRPGSRSTAIRRRAGQR